MIMMIAGPRQQIIEPGVGDDHVCVPIFEGLGYRCIGSVFVAHHPWSWLLLITDDYTGHDYGRNQ